MNASEISALVVSGVALAGALTAYIRAHLAAAKAQVASNKLDALREDTAAAKVQAISDRLDAHLLSEQQSEKPPNSPL